MAIKRFLLFAGDTYYPSGGWGDFISCHDDIDSANVAGARWAIERNNAPYQWWHVVDMDADLTAMAEAVQSRDRNVEGLTIGQEGE